MKRILLAVCGVATAATLLSAQTPPSSTSPQTPAPQTMADTHGKPGDRNVSLTGCVRSGEGSGDYVLARASDDMAGSASTGTAGSASSATGTAGTSGLSGSDAWSLGNKFRLSGKTSDLKDHLNHKVEISGTLGAPSSYGAGSGSTSATGSTESSAAKSLPQINVKSVRMISETCS